MCVCLSVLTETIWDVRQWANFLFQQLSLHNLLSNFMHTSPLYAMKMSGVHFFETSTSVYFLTTIWLSTYFHIYQCSMFTLKSLNKIQHSLLHSRLLGTPSANVFTQYTQMSYMKAQKCKTLGTMDSWECIKCSNILISPANNNSLPDAWQVGKSCSTLQSHSNTSLACHVSRYMIHSHPVHLGQKCQRQEGRELWCQLEGHQTVSQPDSIWKEREGSCRR